jgi:hypothetical protein
MKTKYKIFIVLGSFVGFYFASIFALQLCNQSDSDCTIFQELVLLTRLSVRVDFWDNQSSFEWTSSAEGIESSSTIDLLKLNQKFILSMIVFPSSVIAAIVIWNKRK